MAFVAALPEIAEGAGGAEAAGAAGGEAGGGMKPPTGGLPNPMHSLFNDRRLRGNPEGALSNVKAAQGA